MINIGILGGETEAAGELIRILINHPDVILRQVASPEHAGLRVDSFHRGLTGDTDLCFTRELDDPKLNCVFLLGEPWQAREYVEQADSRSHVSQLNEDEEPEDFLHIIDMTGSWLNGGEGMVYGFPEFRRKALVRGALRASVPSPTATLLELALFPLAKNHLLEGTINVKVTLPHRALTAPVIDSHYDQALSTRLDPIAPIENRTDASIAAGEALRELRQIDSTFNGTLNVSQSVSAVTTRGLRADIEIGAGISADEARHLFEEAYSDHSFTFLLDREPEVVDVANTNKCLLQITPADITGARPGLRITAVMDALVKGCAGTAVHCMNLLFGLSERTGLALKASMI